MHCTAPWHHKTTSEYEHTWCCCLSGYFHLSNEDSERLEIYCTAFISHPLMTADSFFISPMISTNKKLNTIPTTWAIDIWIWKRLSEKLIVFSLTVDSVNDENTTDAEATHSTWITKNQFRWVVLCRCVLWSARSMRLLWQIVRSNYSFWPWISRYLDQSVWCCFKML